MNKYTNTTSVYGVLSKALQVLCLGNTHKGLENSIISTLHVSLCLSVLQAEKEKHTIVSVCLAFFLIYIAVVQCFVHCTAQQILLQVSRSTPPTPKEETGSFLLLQQVHGHVHGKGNRCRCQLWMNYLRNKQGSAPL